MNPTPCNLTDSNVYEKRTVIVVAHRLATSTGADYIHVIEKGHLAKEGTAEKLKSGSGLFSHLYAKQNLGLL